MAEAPLSRYEEIRRERMESAEFRERYEQTRRSLALTQEFLQQLDAHRKKTGLSRAELARRAGANPATQRWLIQ